jgi:hypothetical protein
MIGLGAFVAAFLELFKFFFPQCPCVRVSVVTVVNGSLDLAARAERLKAFLFDLATMDAATEVTVQWQMHRTRGVRVIRR